MLTTVHIFFGTKGDNDARRVEEIGAVAKFIKDRAKKEGENNILLGDFNIVKTTHATMNALLNQGFYIPEAIREHPTDLKKTSHYDQIAFKLKMDSSMTVFSEGDQHAGAFNFTETVYRQEDLATYRGYFNEETINRLIEKNTKYAPEKVIEDYYLGTWRTFQMSDHLPLWIELKVDFSDQYLKKIL